MRNRQEAVVVRMHPDKYNEPEYWQTCAQNYRAQATDYHDPQTRKIMMNMAQLAEQLGKQVAEHDDIGRNFVAIRYSPDDIAGLILKDALRRLGNRSLRLEGDENGGFIVRTNNE